MIEPRTLPGFMELLPQDQILFNKMKDIIKKNYEKFGFLPLDTPVLESSSVLLAKAGGETEKQIYSFKKGDNDLCMRFDLTVPLAKYVAANFNDLAFPFARYQIGKVYRGERPQKGRFREFYQCDIDVVGRDNLSLYYDALIPCVMYNIFKELEVGDFCIELNNRKILWGLLESLGLQEKSQEVLRIVDKLAKIGEENFVDLLKTELALSDEAISKLLAFVKISGDNNAQIQKLEQMNISSDVFTLGISELKEVIEALRAFGVPEDNFLINLSIARGLDYYTGTVYETFIKGRENFGSVCSGGRYDNLAGFYTNAHLPGVGMSIGLTRLFHLFKENNMLKSEQSSISKAIILPMGNTIKESIELSNIIRNNNIPCTIYLENSKFKNKISYASKLGIKYAIFVGEDEIKNQRYGVKDLFNFNQEELSVDELINKLKND